jgi:hypothetical protein
VPFSGVIPTLNIPAPLSSLGAQAIGVAISPLLGRKISNSIGIPNQSSFDLQNLPSSLASSIPDYDLGGFEGVLNSFVGSTVSGLFGQGSSGSGNSGIQYPGAGDEPEAQYGGSVYNTSTPVVFSINRAEAKAKSEGMGDLLSGGGNPAGIFNGEIPNYAQTFASTKPLVNVAGNYGSSGSLLIQGSTQKGAMDYSKSFSTPAQSYYGG